MTPFGRYFGARLHRRLFLWFGASILVTGVVASGVMWAVNSVVGASWSREFENAKLFLGNRFAEVWDEPGRRDALVDSVARELQVGLIAQDATGRTLTTRGQCGHYFHDVPVVSNSEKLGVVRVCVTRSHRGGLLRALLPLLLAGVVLWAAAGKLARRLARPLEDVARVAQDIGAGKLASRALLSCNKHDEVGVLAESINDMAARIERQVQDQRELLAAVSHELRTPLSRLRLLTELARGNPSEKTLDQIDREVMEIDALVGDLLANSRLDFHALTPAKLDAIDVGRRALERAGLDETLLAADAPSLVFQADATLLARALANLIHNAQQHGRGLKRLRVNTRGDFIAFEAEDGGGGFAPGDEERVFDPFFHKQRAQDGDASLPMSLGLGLTLVRRIAQAHGGTAYAANLDGGGARVGFEVAMTPRLDETGGTPGTRS